MTEKRRTENLGLDVSGLSDPAFGKSLAQRNALTSHINSETSAPLVSFSKSASVTPEGWATHKSMSINWSGDKLSNEGSGSYFGTATMPEPGVKWVLRYIMRNRLRVGESSAAYNIRYCASRIARKGRLGVNHVGSGSGLDQASSSFLDSYQDWFLSAPAKYKKDGVVMLMSYFGAPDSTVLVMTSGYGMVYKYLSYNLDEDRFYVHDASIWPDQYASDLVFMYIAKQAGNKFYTYSALTYKKYADDVYLTWLIVLIQDLGSSVQVYKAPVPIARVGDHDAMKEYHGVAAQTGSRYLYGFLPPVPSKYVPYYSMVDMAWATPSTGYYLELDFSPWPLFWNTEDIRCNPNWVAGFTSEASETDPITGTTYRDPEAHIVMCQFPNPDQEVGGTISRPCGFYIPQLYIPTGNPVTTDTVMSGSMGVGDPGSSSIPAKPVATPYLGRIHKLDDYGNKTLVTNLIPLLQARITPPDDSTPHALIKGTGASMFDHDGKVILGLSCDVIWGQHIFELEEPTCDDYGYYKNQFVYDNSEENKSAEQRVFYILLSGTTASIIYDEIVGNYYWGGFAYDGRGSSFGFVSESESVFYAVQTRYDSDTNYEPQNYVGAYYPSKVHRFRRNIDGSFVKDHTYTLSIGVGGNQNYQPRVSYEFDLGTVKGINPILPKENELIIPHVIKDEAKTVHLKYLLDNTGGVAEVEETVYAVGENSDPEDAVEEYDLYIYPGHTYATIEDWEKQDLWSDNHKTTL